METIKKRFYDMSLKKFYLLIVLMTITVVILLSTISIYGCNAIRNYLLPEPDSIYLTIEWVYQDPDYTTRSYSNTQLMKFNEIQEFNILKDTSLDETLLDSKYAVSKIENAYNYLSSFEQLVYKSAGIAMFVMPFIYALIGILVCGLYFYQFKFDKPFQLLLHATKKVTNQDLDFSLDYQSKDELGKLCNSFEVMRKTLVKNNQEMWNLLAQRKLLQASVAHDLRNPIAILEGYIEYLQLSCNNHTLDSDKLQRIINNMNHAAKRLEQYTDSVKLINQFEDLEVTREPITSLDLIKHIEEDFNMLHSNEICIQIQQHLPMTTLSLDKTILYRILENLINNAMRFAQSKIVVDFKLNNRKLIVQVIDDGKGFSQEVLNKKEKTLVFTNQEEGHLGIGLTICKLLCMKHGGSLNIYNNELAHGVVEISLSI